MAQSLSNLPIGAKIKFGKYSVNGETAQDIIWLIVAKNHSGYPSNAITLLTERVIDVRPFDARETGLPDGNSGGNNNYSVSNIDQWLNKSTSPWYVAAHSKDMPPSAGDYMTPGAEYTTRPGFLNAFTEQERSKILSTTIRAKEYGVGVTSIARQVFLPSWIELSGNTAYGDEGALWEYFVTGSRAAKFTEQFVKNHLINATYDSYNNATYFLRTAEGNNANYVCAASGTQSMSRHSASSISGIRPALNLSSTDMVSDTTDSDGCYTVIPNTAPNTPASLNVPTVYGGKSFTVSWGKANDTDGDAITYHLERSLNGGAYELIYSGTNLSYSTTVAYGTGTVSFRIRASDVHGASSGYRTSSTISVINNTAPQIVGTDGLDLGTRSEGFTTSYIIRDSESNTVTVTERIDGAFVRSYVVTLGATNTFDVTGNTWAALANGSHTLTIVASDGIDSTTRTMSFVKSVSMFTIQNTTPLTASNMPKRIKVSVNKTIPVEATMKVEVCNNGYDASPKWEDATSATNSGLVHLFTNTTKTATNWGVRIRVTVNRNGGSGACYVSSIGGNFE